MAHLAECAEQRLDIGCSERPAGGGALRVPDVDEVLQRLREVGEASLGLGADDDEIAEAERVLGLTIPGAYRTFIREVGWASVRGLEVFGLGEEVPAELDVRTVTTEIRESMPSNALPFARDEGENFCLDAEHEGPYESPVFRWRPEAASKDALEYAGHDFASWLWMRLAERA